MEIGKRIANLLKIRGITQYRLGKMTGLSQSTISDLIHGKNKNPSSELVSKIAVALGTTVDFILNASQEELVLHNLKLAMGDMSVPEFAGLINSPEITENLLQAFLDKKIDLSVKSIATIAEALGIDFNWFYKNNKDLESLNKAKSEYINHVKDFKDIIVAEKAQKIYDIDSELFDELYKAKDLPTSERQKIKEYSAMLTEKHSKQSSK